MFTKALNAYLLFEVIWKVGLQILIKRLQNWVFFNIYHVLALTWSVYFVQAGYFLSIGLVVCIYTILAA